MNNEERILEILTGMQTDISGLKQGQANLEQGQAKLEKGLSEVKEMAEVTRDAVLRLELVEMPRIQAALDGVVANQEKLKDHEKRISSIEKTIDRYEFKKAVFKTT